MLPTIEYNHSTDFPLVPRIPVREGEKWIKHVHCDGARFHVLSYLLVMGKDGIAHSETRCSEPNCIYNKR